MATFVIGDIHGCFRTLQLLLKSIGFDPSHDRIWLVGDLVNRGPRSLDVLRWAKQLGDRMVCVLGNHDLKLLAHALGVRFSRENPRLSPILAAEDHDELLTWLRRRPLVYCEREFVLVHAGLLPGWTLDEALKLSREIQALLTGPKAAGLLQCLSWKSLPAWKEVAPELHRLTMALKAMTQVRTLDRAGVMDLSFAGPLAEMPATLIPWFAFPGRHVTPGTILFGHWAALGLFQAPGITALDSNCVRGGSLTALRLEDGQIFQQQFAD